MTTKLGIVGYGNLGKAAAQNIQATDDLELVGIFTRRAPESVNCPYAKTYHVDDLNNFADKIDVLLLCGGSANDLMQQGPSFAGKFNTVDTFDTHAKIPVYFPKMNELATSGKKVSIISVGWDPGLFSINRVYADSILPDSTICAFWGPGVSQGHSNALRDIDGVADAVQFTIPFQEQIEKVSAGEKISTKAEDTHRRVCYVVLKDGADAESIKQQIVEMPNYFKGYQTEVNFISKAEFDEKYKGKLPHGGDVIGFGRGPNGEKLKIHYNLALDSNPCFTSCVVLAYARAAYRLAQEGQFGAKSVFDIPPSYLSKHSREELLGHYL